MMFPESLINPYLNIADFERLKRSATNTAFRESSTALLEFPANSGRWNGIWSNGVAG